MSSRNYISIVISFFLYVLFQVLLLKNFILFDTAFCFLYVAFILMLPLEMGPLTIMIISFLVGFSVERVYDSIGINAAASTFIAASILSDRPSSCHEAGVINEQGQYVPLSRRGDLF